METGIKNWGNSQGIRIPKEYLVQLGITTDTPLDIRIEGENIVISKAFRHKTLDERIKLYGELAEPTEEITYGDPVGREVW